MNKFEFNLKTNMIQIYYRYLREILKMFYIIYLGMTL